MTAPFKLEDFQPETGSFSLSTTGKHYNLRKFSMADEIWLKKKYGDDGEIQKIFSNVEFEKIIEIAFHQMVNEDRGDFVKQKVTFIDDNGDKAEVEIGGSALLFQMVAGWQEKKAILNALLQTIGVSRPVLEKIEKQINSKVDSELKKKITPLTGSESSTSSAGNTDGQ